MRKKSVDDYTTYWRTYRGVASFIGEDRTRLPRLTEYAERMIDIHNKHKVTDTINISPTILQPLLNAALDETRGELFDIYARLLAAAGDPNKSSCFRMAFIKIISELDPVDIIVLHAIYTAIDVNECSPARIIPEHLAEVLGMSVSTVHVSLSNLVDVKCLLSSWEDHISRDMGNVMTSLGWELMRCCYF